MKLSDIRSAAGANKDRKRVGRGARLRPWQDCRSGHQGPEGPYRRQCPPRFQGGQTPIQQQLPYKRGFTNIWRVRYNMVNLEQLGIDGEAGTDVTPESLLELGIMRDTEKPLKVLGDGELGKLRSISPRTKSAKAHDRRSRAAGGSITLIETANRASPLEGPHRSPGARS